jgi:hypothetical protein
MRRITLAVLLASFVLPATSAHAERFARLKAIVRKWAGPAPDVKQGLAANGQEKLVSKKDEAKVEEPKPTSQFRPVLEAAIQAAEHAYQGSPKQIADDKQAADKAERARTEKIRHDGVAHVLTELGGSKQLAASMQKLGKKQITLASATSGAKIVARPSAAGIDLYVTIPPQYDNQHYYDMADTFRMGYSSRYGGSGLIFADDEKKISLTESEAFVVSSDRHRASLGLQRVLNYFHWVSEESLRGELAKWASALTPPAAK